MITNDPQIDLGRRIQELERGARQLRIVVLTLVAVFVLSAAATVPLLLRRGNTLEGRELVLRDRHGTIRARLATEQRDEYDATLFQLFDADAKPIAALEGKENGSGAFRFFGLEGHPQAELVADPSGPGLTFYADGGAPRAWFGILGQSPSVELIDDDGMPRAALRMASGRPFLNFFDADGKQVPAGAFGSGSGRRQGTGSGQTLLEADDIRETTRFHLRRRLPPGTLG